MNGRLAARCLARAAVVFGLAGLAACGGERKEPPRAEPFMVLPPLAGVSARKAIDVDPARPGDFGADTTGPVWHRFQHRCAACHAAPSPAQHPAYEWARVVQRMEKNVGAAGLLPLSGQESKAITELLEKHAPKSR